MGIGINAKLVKFAIISAQKILPAGHEIVFCIAISQQNLPGFYRLPCKTAEKVAEEQKAYLRGKRYENEKLKVGWR